MADTSTWENLYKQVKWERDVAMEQLKSMGVSFGEKTDDVVRVVRCKDCKHYEPGGSWCNIHSYYWDDEGMPCSHVESDSWNMFGEDDFCSCGERK